MYLSSSSQLYCNVADYVHLFYIFIVTLYLLLFQTDIIILSIDGYNLLCAVYDYFSCILRMHTGYVSDKQIAIFR